MLRIVDRYLFRELLGSFGAVSVVLLLVTLGGALTVTLDRIARGKVPATLLLSQIGLRSIDALPLLLPLALFLAVILAYGRVYRDSEMAVLSGSGLGTPGLLRPLAWLTLPLVALLALCSFLFGPAALRASDAMIDDAHRSLLVVGLEPGRFVELPGGNGVVYVNTMSAGGARFERLFVYHEREARVDITTAAHGEVYQDRDGSERYLALERGFRVEGQLEGPDFRTMRFAHNDIRLPDVGANRDPRTRTRARNRELWASSEPVDRAELHWRVGLPLSAAVLALLALPLARAEPREPRYGKGLLAVFAYVVYANVLALGRAWLADGTLPPALGLWWIHGAVLLLAAWLWSQERRRFRRSVRA
jgi:lipopolysaccharide export system permease protein